MQYYNKLFINLSRLNSDLCWVLVLVAKGQPNDSAVEQLQFTCWVRYSVGGDSGPLVGGALLRCPVARYWPAQGGKRRPHVNRRVWQWLRVG